MTCALLLAGLLLAPALISPREGENPVSARRAARGGDVFFEQTTVPFADGRRAGPGVVSRVWASGRRLRMEAVGGAGALILRLDEGRAWRLDTARRTAVALDVARLRARAQMDVSTAADLMGTGPDGRVRTTAFGAARTVAGHVCTPFRIAAPSVVMEVCVARDLPVGIEAFASLLEWSGASEGLAPLVQALRDLEGFPLETRSRVSVLGEVQETLSTVTLVRVAPVAATLFRPPPGWRLEPESGGAE